MGDDIDVLDVHKACLLNNFVPFWTTHSLCLNGDSLSCLVFDTIILLTGFAIVISEFYFCELHFNESETTCLLANSEYTF